MMMMLMIMMMVMMVMMIVMVMVMMLMMMMIIFTWIVIKGTGFAWRARLPHPPWGPDPRQQLSHAPSRSPQARVYSRAR